MFFTKAGRVVAWIGTVLGFVVMLTGYEIDINGTASIFADMLPIATPERAAAQSDVFRHQGAVVLFYSLVLGVLCDISRSAARKAEIQGE
jgi:hypothetical protein